LVDWYDDTTCVLKVLTGSDWLADDGDSRPQNDDEDQLPIHLINSHNVCLRLVSVVS